MIVRTSLPVVLVAIILGINQSSLIAQANVEALGNLVNGVGSQINQLGQLSGNLLNPLANPANTLNAVGNLVSRPLSRALGAAGQLNNAVENGIAGLGGLPGSVLGSITSGLGSLGGITNPSIAASTSLSATRGLANGIAASGALASGAAAAAGAAEAASAAASSASYGAGLGYRNSMYAGGLGGNMMLNGASLGRQAALSAGSEALAIDAAARTGYSAASRSIDTAVTSSIPEVGALGAASPLVAAPLAAATQVAANLVRGPLNPAETVTGASVGPAIDALAATQGVARQALVNDAVDNAHNEAAIAGADMVNHGINNARSAALASNAYRQAKLATARDRVNIAGTVQNSARISDAAIATHDASTKAEDSLLGSELAVDSAATVLDSDAAYIPPVTNSLLRSLPYGRLSLRNIVPKPLTYPSGLLPDVWLNGIPVNYLNVPLRGLSLPFGLPAGRSGWPMIPGQTLFYNNGIGLNGFVMDPTLAFLSRNMNNVAGSSILPILANGQVEALDEINMANLVTMSQLAGSGMPETYYGYGRTNPVPLLTGSVSDANLVPTTTIGTTYPIGSALVIEPRDSYFQDYTDNASSRQNFDEHHH